MAGKTITKEEFQKLVSILNANKLTTPVAPIFNNNGYDDGYGYDDYIGENENDFVCTNCGDCSCDCDEETTDVVDEDGDIDILAMVEILEEDFFDNWKEFVYVLIEAGYVDIPSCKIADFVNDEFNTVVSARTIAAVKASANR